MTATIPLCEGLVEACRRGPALASQWLWTPLILLNSPYHGSANGSRSSSILTFTSGGLTLSSAIGQGTVQIGASDGQATGFFELDEWTIYSTYNQYQAGFEDGACTQPYVAQITSSPCSSGSPGCQIVTHELLPMGTRSDEGEPTHLSAGGYPSVEFRNGYDPAAPPAGTLMDCAPGLTMSTSGNQAPGETLTVTIGGRSASGSLRGDGSSTNTYSYTFPTTGTWSWQALGGSPNNGAWSFRYVGSTC